MRWHKDEFNFMGVEYESGSLCRGKRRGCSLKMLKRPLDVFVACLREPRSAGKRPLAEPMYDSVREPACDRRGHLRVRRRFVRRAECERFDDVTFDDSAHANAERGGLWRGYKVEVSEQRVRLVGRVGCIHRDYARRLEPVLLLRESRRRRIAPHAESLVPVRSESHLREPRLCVKLEVELSRGTHAAVEGLDCLREGELP